MLEELSWNEGSNEVASLAEKRTVVRHSDHALSGNTGFSSQLRKVYVVARKAIVRAALARLVSSAGFKAVELCEADELLKWQPEEGIVVIHECDDQGASAMCAALSDQNMWLPVIGYCTEVDPRRVIDGMKAGAMDFMVGQVSKPELTALLEECERKASFLADRRRRRAMARHQLSKLSKREREVLDLVASGLSSKEAAKELELSPRTVEVHRLRMLSKLGAATAAQAVSIASAANL